MSAASETIADWVTELAGVPAAAPLRVTVEFHAPSCYGIPEGFGDGWRMARHAISFTELRSEIVRHQVVFEQVPS